MTIMILEKINNIKYFVKKVYQIKFKIAKFIYKHAYTSMLKKLFVGVMMVSA